MYKLHGGRNYRHRFMWRTRHTRDRSIYDTYLATLAMNLPLIIINSYIEILE